MKDQFPSAPKYPVKRQLPEHRQEEFESPKYGEKKTDRFDKDLVYEACREFLGRNVFETLMMSDIPMYKIMELAMFQAVDKGIDLNEKEAVRHFDNLRVAMRFAKVAFK